MMKDPKQTLILYFSVFICSISSLAQVPPDKKMNAEIQLGGYAEFCNFRNPAYSSLVYSGSVPGVNLRLKIGSERFEQNIQGSFSTGTLTVSNAVGATVDQQLLNVLYHNYFKIDHSGNGLFSIKAGLMAQFQHSQRQETEFINSGVLNQSVFSIGLAAGLEYRLNESDRSWRICNKIIFPIMFYYNQLPYSPVGESSESVKTRYQLALIPELIQFSNQIIIEKHFSDSFGFSVYYDWNFTHINDFSHLKQSSQIVGINGIYTL